MTDSPVDALDPALVDEVRPAEAVLPTFRVLARLASAAPDDDAALAEVAQRLSSQRGLYDELVVERTEDDGTRLVVARYVVVAVEATAAVAGVHAELTGAGVDVDEVWAEPLG